MTSLRVLDVCVLFIWMIIDGIVVFGRRAKGTTRGDRFSMLGIVLAVWVGVGLAITLGFAGVGGLGGVTIVAQIAGLALLAVGIIVRSVAIAQLGPLHTPDVAIQEGHRVVDTGLYRHVRHPSYLGACIALLGFGLGLGSWVSAVVVLGMVLIAYAYRIRVEEQALLLGLGDAYADYQARTCRLIPGIY